MANTSSSIEHYVKIFNEFIQAWNRADVEAVASFYTDDLDYRDPSVPAGIRDKKAMIDYLRLMFGVWPRQEWVVGDLFQHKDDGSFTGQYRFTIANDKTSISGHGMDLVIFRGDKIRTNHVYLNADKWNSWIKRELTK
jgi:hypothetical protein